MTHPTILWGRAQTLGVKCLHKQNLAHLDIKPGNIFIKTEVSMESESESVSDRSTMSPTTTEAPDTEVFEEVFGESVERRNTPPPSAVRQKTKVYKLGDLGMVTRIDEPSVEEGDCRYLSREIMNEDYTHLAKADIFSLGCSLYEAASGHELPKNGPEWHQVGTTHPYACCRGPGGCSARRNHLGLPGGSSHHQPLVVLTSYSSPSRALCSCEMARRSRCRATRCS